MIFALSRQKPMRGSSPPFSGISLATFVLKASIHGFSPDLSAGVNLGVKLPTGDFKFDPKIVDRDTQLGTGSTDILMGGFYRHHINLRAKLFWFAQTELDLPVLTKNIIVPGWS